MNYVQGYAQGCQERNIKASSLPNTPSDQMETTMFLFPE